MKTISLLSLLALAASPVSVDRTSYDNWLTETQSVKSPYFSPLFDWYEAQAGCALPPQVEADSEKLYVTVEQPIRDTDKAEEEGEVEPGTTYGLETYGIVDASVDQVLETILFRWGKPVGQQQGVTYPIDSVYGYRQEKLERVSEGSYRTVTILKNGGVAKDQNDISTLLVRSDGRGGYVLFGQFFGPNGRTASTSSMSIMILGAREDGKTDYRVSGRYTGQSYSLFGIEFGRRNYGFNAGRIRAGQKDFYNQVAELKTKGKISERKP